MRKYYIILGSIFLASGLGIISFTLWDLTINNAAKSSEQQQVADQLDRQWQSNIISSEPIEDDGIGSEGEPFAKMHIPVWGEYVKPIIKGTNSKSLDLGIGHYSSTADAGQVGNFAVAAHRTIAGANFENIDMLKYGDKIYVETETHIYQYEVRNTIIVPPNKVEVLNPVPYGIKKTEGDSESIITLTSCHPKWGDQERIIAYGVLTKEYIKDGNEGKMKNIFTP